MIQYATRYPMNGQYQVHLEILNNICQEDKLKSNDGEHKQTRMLVSVVPRLMGCVESDLGSIECLSSGPET